jgi:hypothetical protein
MARLTMEKLMKRETTPATREAYFPITARKKQKRVAAEQVTAELGRQQSNEMKKTTV